MLYKGRFAPSPTGPLHFGSLVAAAASYLQAISRNGEWLLRIEDIDPPREKPKAAEQIIETLKTHGFQWSGAVQYQSDNIDRFEAIVESLLERDLAFPCACSRRQIKRIAKTGPLGAIYPGTCRDRTDLHPTTGDPATPLAIRLRTNPDTVTFDDRIRGHLSGSISNDIGDFIIRRADGLIAYTLAVVVDDHDQGITEVVRGDDLLEFTPAQIFLQRILGFDTPGYMHVPVAVNVSGEKLSKQTGAVPVDNSRAVANLCDCLKFLRQQPPESLRAASVTDLWAWAGANWKPEKLVS